MRILTLEKRTRAPTPNYRGTSRGGWALHHDELPDDHPLNRLFFRFLAEGPVGEFSNAEHAIDMVREYTKLDPSLSLEVVEITRGADHPETGTTTFLGYDLSNGFISLLEGGLKSPEKPLVASDDQLVMLEPLFDLVEECFRPRLNDNGLFSDYESAHLCLEAMKTLNKLRPGSYESETIMEEFEITGVWHVFSPSGS